MGIIKKQSIIGSTYTIIGVGLGFLLQAILFPKILETEQIGLLRVLVSYSMIFAVLSALGTNAITNRLFPYFRDPNTKHNGYIALILIISFIGFIFFSFFYELLSSTIIESSREKSSLFIPYYYYVIPLAFFTMLFSAFDNYYKVLFNATIGTFYKEIFQRILVIVVVVLYFFKIISFHELVICYLIALSLPTLAIFFSLLKAKQFTFIPSFHFLDKRTKKEMTSVGAYGLIASFSGFLIQTIGVIVVNDQLGLELTGVFSVCVFFITLILVPMRSLAKISMAVIAESWKRNDLKTISNVYKQSSINLSALGLLIYTGLVINVDNIFHVIGVEYLPGKSIIIIGGIAYLSDVFLGINQQIITTSSAYRWSAYLIGINAMLMIVFNLWLIPVYGIDGAAYAILLSRIFFNLLKFLIVYFKFGFQPFHKKHLVLIVISILLNYLTGFIPVFQDYIVDIMLRSSIAATFFISISYIFNVSDDLNNVLEKKYKYFRRKVKN